MDVYSDLDHAAYILRHVWESFEVPILTEKACHSEFLRQDQQLREFRKFMKII